MDRSVYLTNLRRLRITGANPGIPHAAALLAACPHLGNLRLAADLLDQGVCIALPAVKVKEAFWRLTKKGSCLWLRPDRVIPTHKISPGERHIPAFQSGEEPPKFLQEALRYPEVHWPCDLQVDTSLFSGWFEVCDPMQPITGQGGCKPLTAGCATFKVSLEYLQRLAPKQLPTEFNRAVIHGSVTDIERDELRGTTTKLFRYCSGCGHWLARHCCPGCGIEFPAFRVPHEQGFAIPDLLLIKWRESRLWPFTQDPSVWR